MAFQKNASDQEICEQLCPYQIGDKVTLTKKLAAGNGFFEHGTVLKIQSVAVRSDLKIHAVPLENLSAYHADIGVFTFELEDPETGIKAKATADYWGSSLISQKRMRFLLFKIWILPIIIGFVSLIFHFINKNDACAAALIFVFFAAFAVSDTWQLKNNLHPSIWICKQHKNDKTK